MLPAFSSSPLRSCSYGPCHLNAAPAPTMPTNLCGRAHQHVLHLTTPASYCRLSRSGRRRTASCACWRSWASGMRRASSSSLWRHRCVVLCWRFTQRLMPCQRQLTMPGAISICRKQRSPQATVMHCVHRPTVTKPTPFPLAAHCYHSALTLPTAGEM